MLEPESHLVGTVNEDFAVESLQGDVFQLGNTSYRILRVERGTVRVEDAHGQPPSIPFWLGEAPGRTEELSRAVSGLRKEIEQRLSNAAGAESAIGGAIGGVIGRGAELGAEPGAGRSSEPAAERNVELSVEGSADRSIEPSVGGNVEPGAEPNSAMGWLLDTVGLDEAAAFQLVQYLAAGRAALGCLPTFDTVIFERFFDESGGMQLVIHSPFGSRVNRAGVSLCASGSAVRSTSNCRRRRPRITSYCR